MSATTIKVEAPKQTSKATETTTAKKKPFKITGLNTACQFLCKYWVEGTYKYGTEIVASVRHLLEINGIKTNSMDGTIMRTFRLYRDQYGIKCSDPSTSCYLKGEVKPVKPVSSSANKVESKPTNTKSSNTKATSKQTTTSKKVTKK